MSLDPLMDALDRDTCRYCPAEIAFAMTENGRRMPLDPQAHPEGNIRLYKHASGEIRVTVYRSAQAATAAEDVIGPYESVALYRSHFVTCPGAKDARRRRGGKSGKS